jgi:nicotinamidase-related amidase
MSTAMLLIDPQNDFCEPWGSLYVPGAEADCRRLSAFLDAKGADIDAVYVTLDCHNYYSIFHPVFWRGADNKPPAPFTAITGANMDAGQFAPADASQWETARKYVRTLEEHGRYSLTIWPPHCVIATPGQCAQSDVWNALRRWEGQKPGRSVSYILKGTHRTTEHYSAIASEAPDPAAPETQTNTALIADLRGADKVIIAGEALSHCVAFTVRDLLARIPGGRMTVLADCTSPVAGFERAPFLEEFESAGIGCVKAGNA